MKDELDGEPLLVWGATDQLSFPSVPGLRLGPLPLCLHSHPSRTRPVYTPKIPSPCLPHRPLSRAPDSCYQLLTPRLCSDTVISNTTVSATAHGPSTGPHVINGHSLRVIPLLTTTTPPPQLTCRQTWVTPTPTITRIHPCVTTWSPLPSLLTRTVVKASSVVSP